MTCWYQMWCKFKWLWQYKCKENPNNLQMDLIAFAISTKKNKFIKFLLQSTSPRYVDRQNIPKTLAPTKIAQRQTFFFLRTHRSGTDSPVRRICFNFHDRRPRVSLCVCSARKPSNAKVIIASPASLWCIHRNRKFWRLWLLANSGSANRKVKVNPEFSQRRLPSTGNSSEI